jgi:ABC-type amino acid transport substrate-binding protein
MTFATLTSCALGGSLRINWRRLPIQIVMTVVFLGVIVASIHGYLETSFKKHYSKDNLITGRELLHDVQSIDAQVLRTAAEAGPNPDSLLPGESRVERVRRRGTIRVGYDPDELPFSYFNANDELVGFDVEMAYRLARNMRVNVEFVPFRTATLIEQLEADHFDVAMSGLEGTLKRAAELGLGDSYLDVTLAVVVLDFRKGELKSLDKIMAAENLKLAVIRNSFFAERMADAVPHADIVEVDSERDYFTSEYQRVDALVTSAETGSAWTLRRPQFSVLNPLAQSVHVPLYYITLPDSEWREFLDKWLELVTKTGFKRDLYNYWILGIDQKKAAPRWCIMRDVLHWVD